MIETRKSKGKHGKRFDEINVVKRYFSRIFTVLSKETREKLNKLNISEDEKKRLIKDLGFLKKEKQTEYLEEFRSLFNHLKKEQ